MFDIDIAGQEPMEEEDPAPRDPMPAEDLHGQLTQADIELTALIAKSLEPIQKECMAWEKRILHSASFSFPKVGDAEKK